MVKAKSSKGQKKSTRDMCQAQGRGRGKQDRNFEKKTRIEKRHRRLAPMRKKRGSGHEEKRLWKGRKVRKGGAKKNPHKNFGGAEKDFKESAVRESVQLEHRGG